MSQVETGAIFWYRLGYLQLTVCWLHVNKDLGQNEHYMDVFILM